MEEKMSKKDMYEKRIGEFRLEREDLQMHTPRLNMAFYYYAVPKEKGVRLECNVENMGFEVVMDTFRFGADDYILRSKKHPDIVISHGDWGNPTYLKYRDKNEGIDIHLGLSYYSPRNTLADLQKPVVVWHIDDTIIEKAIEKMTSKEPASQPFPESICKLLEDMVQEGQTYEKEVYEGVYQSQLTEEEEVQIELIKKYGESPK